MTISSRVAAAARAALIVAVVAAGAGAGGARASAPPTSEPAATDPAPTTPTATDVVTSTAPATGESAWAEIVAGADCVCADGAEFSFFVRHADPKKVMFFLEGGGACFDAVSCAFSEDDSTTYDWDIGADDDPALMSGIFDFSNERNPFADYSVVYVPYCTGDVHLGDTTREYSPDLTVEHNGYVNGTTALGYLAENFPDAEQVVVVGESAGSIAAAVYAGLAGDALPDAQVTVFADGSGAYPDSASLNAGMGGLWGVVHPEWAADVPPEEWSIPAMVERAGLHNPDIVMSRFDFAYDATQGAFMLALGLTDDLLETADLNEARIEAAGVNQFSFTAPGEDHTLVRRDEFYTMELNGVSLVDWVTAIVKGETVEDVHCEECGSP